jgi:hypothetical protein
MSDVIYAPIVARYADYIETRAQSDEDAGFAPNFMHDKLYPFQAHLVEWSVRKGRDAIFADCGLGKTLMQQTWAENVARHTGKPVLGVAPLSVSLQSVDEAHKFGLDARRSLDGSATGARIIMTNYERLTRFNPDDFGGVFCDESSIMKNFDGTRRTEITAFMRKMRFRLLCTATAAPNDYVELGTSSEALGYLGHMDMLGTFFKNDEGSLHPAFVGSKWRFKQHAQRDFWRWVCSWARACRKPSDLGFDDGDFVLPPLIERDHVVQSPPTPGALFPLKAITLEEQREERKATIKARCELAASLVDHGRPAVCWAQLNAEADLLAAIIPGAVQVSGSDSDEAKEEAFTAFARGQIRVLVTKPKIAAFGMNWQHCAHHTYFPDHSFEQYYQATRRSYRFGQKRPVEVDCIISESNVGVSENLRRKAEACSAMFEDLVTQMQSAMSISRFRSHTKQMEVPSWL